MGSQLYFGEPGKGHKRVFSDFSGHFIVPRVTLLSPFSSQVHLGAPISLGYTEGADLDTTLTLCRLKNKLLFWSMRHQNHLEPLWKTGEADGAFWIISRSSFQRRTHHDFFAFFLWSGAFFVVFFLWWSYFLVVSRCKRCCWKSLLSFYFVGFLSVLFLAVVALNAQILTWFCIQNFSFIVDMLRWGRK